MKIKITNEKCGLEKGKVYDLCTMSANTLVRKGQAVFVKETNTSKTTTKK